MVSLLKYCRTLSEKYRETDDYQDELMSKSLELGASTKDKTVLLDMDETMIAAKLGDKLPKNFHPTFQFQFSGSTISVKVRPYLHDVLEKIAQLFEIIVFTAGVKEYADPILDQLDPDGKLFKKRLYRDSCIKVEQFFIKDLDIILDRDKDTVCIVDNSILSFAFDLENGVPIDSYMGDEDDKDLLYLVSFLEQAFYQDIKTACAESF